MVDKIEITLRNDHVELNRLAEELEGFLEGHDIGPDVAFKVNLALDELVTNVINYGYEDNGEHAIRLLLTLDGQTLRLVLEDDGKPFNPLDVPPPDLDAQVEDRQVGGLGIHFVRQVMDRVTYRRDAGRNVLTMERRLDHVPATDGE